MYAVEIPAVDYGAFHCTYRLDNADLNPKTRTAAAGETAALVANVWATVRRIDAAQIMVLHHRDRTWVAAGSLLIEGQKGLNIGFLMPTLRGELDEADAGPLPDHKPLADHHRVLWAIATRMARVEAERLYLLDAGETLPIRVTRDGFALPADLAPDVLRSAVVSAAQSGRAIRYSLGASGKTSWGPVHPIAALFADDLAGAEIRVDSDGWPLALPGSASLVEVQLALTLVDVLSPLSQDADCRLQVLGAAARPIVTGTKEAGVWAVRTATPGVAK